MPLYEFMCEECGGGFELLFRSMTERRKPVCPECGSGNVHKCLSVFGAKSKGGEGAASSGGGCASCRAASCRGCKG